MIDRAHDLPIAKQAEVLRISRGSVYYLPLGSSGLLLKRLAQLAQQPCVLDGDDSLSGEVLHQLDKLVGERSRLGTHQPEHANRNAFAHEWHGKDRSELAHTLQLWTIKFRIGQNIWNVDCLPFENCTPESGSTLRFCWIAREMLALLRAQTESCRDRICLALTPPDKASICLTQSRRRFDDGVEYQL